MSSTDTLARIDSHQGTLSELASAMLAAVHAGARQAADRFDDLRLRVVRAQREYQVFKHRQIFNPVIAAGPSPQAEAARGMKASCIAAGETCEQFFRTWSQRDLAACWDAYVAATQEMVGALRAHLTVERRAIAEALDALERRSPPR